MTNIQYGKIRNRRVLNIAQKEKVSMRTAAYMVAVDRVADAITARGIYA